MANSRGRAPGHEFAATGRDGSLEGRTDLVAPKLVASLNATLFVLEGFRSIRARTPPQSWKQVLGGLIDEKTAENLRLVPGRHRFTGLTFEKMRP